MPVFYRETPILLATDTFSRCIVGARVVCIARNSFLPRTGCLKIGTRDSPYGSATESGDLPVKHGSTISNGSPLSATFEIPTAYGDSSRDTAPDSTVVGRRRTDIARSNKLLNWRGRGNVCEQNRNYTTSVAGESATNRDSGRPPNPPVFGKHDKILTRIGSLRFYVRVRAALVPVSSGGRTCAAGSFGEFSKNRIRGKSHFPVFGRITFASPYMVILAVPPPDLSATAHAYHRPRSRTYRVSTGKQPSDREFRPGVVIVQALPSSVPFSSALPRGAAGVPGARRETSTF